VGFRNQFGSFLLFEDFELKKFGSKLPGLEKKRIAKLM
jgi:hypothetical protein